MTEDGVTIEEVVAHSGFAAGTIYDLTYYGVLSPPIRGLDRTCPGSKGLYPVKVLDQIDRYKTLKRQGMKRTAIIELMRTEMQSQGVLNVPIQQGRG